MTYEEILQTFFAPRGPTPAANSSYLQNWTPAQRATLQSVPVGIPADIPAGGAGRGSSGPVANNTASLLSRFYAAHPQYSYMQRPVDSVGTVTNAGASEQSTAGNQGFAPGAGASNLAALSDNKGTISAVLGAINPGLAAVFSGVMNAAQAANQADASLSMAQATANSMNEAHSMQDGYADAAYGGVSLGGEAQGASDGPGSGNGGFNVGEGSI